MFKISPTSKNIWIKIQGLPSIGSSLTFLVAGCAGFAFHQSLFTAMNKFLWFLKVELVTQDLKSQARLSWMSLIRWTFCRKLTKELCEVVEDYGLVSFTTLNIQVCQIFSFWTAILHSTIYNCFSRNVVNDLHVWVFECPFLFGLLSVILEVILTRSCHLIDSLLFMCRIRRVWWTFWR